MNIQSSRVRHRLDRALPYSSSVKRNPTRGQFFMLDKDVRYNRQRTARGPRALQNGGNGSR